jgi:sialidase-1
MSVSFLRLRSGEILFFYLLKNSLADLKVLVRRSSDEAKTWTEPVIVTPRNGYHIMNNARVIQLKSGRILCPVSFCEDIGQPAAHLRNLVFYSDDQGKTWDRSHGFIDVPQRGAMEPGLVQLKNGDVLQIIRTQLGQIWACTSRDEGETWSSAAPFGVPSPESPATIKRVPGKRDLLLIYNPNPSADKMGARTPLAASISRDDGKTWSTPRLIETDPNFSYAYTSVTFDKDRALLTYYYAPYGAGRLSLKFKSIPLRWFYEHETVAKTEN